MSYEDMDPAAVAYSQEIVRSALLMFTDGMTALGVGPHFTCSEAEELAAAMRQVGIDEDGVRTWLRGHADGDDDEDDMHHEMREEEW